MQSIYVTPTVLSISLKLSGAEDEVEVEEIVEVKKLPKSSPVKKKAAVKTKPAPKLAKSVELLELTSSDEEWSTKLDPNDFVYRSPVKSCTLNNATGLNTRAKVSVSTHPIVKKASMANSVSTNTVSDQEVGTIESDSAPDLPSKVAANKKMGSKPALEPESAVLEEPITLDKLTTMTVKMLPSKCQVLKEGMDEELAEAYKGLPNLVQAKVPMVFVSLGRYINPALISLKILSVLFLTPNGNRKLLQVRNKFAVCLTAIHVGSSYLLSQDELSFSTKVLGAVEGAPGTPKRKVIPTFKSPVKLGSQVVKPGPTPITAFFPSILEFHANVPVYDVHGKSFNYQRDLPALASKLPPFKGEVPIDSFAVVGYSAFTYIGGKGHDKVTLGLNVLFVIVVAVP
ncbi:hypothetical protein DXG01_001860 [Tephrocybe rancida]|nr:hypothetical protein DXG01_001860 [Tephrocybe rancida]